MQSSVPDHMHTNRILFSWFCIRHRRVVVVVITLLLSVTQFTTYYT